MPRPRPRARPRPEELPRRDLLLQGSLALGAFFALQLQETQISGHGADQKPPALSPALEMFRHRDRNPFEASLLQAPLTSLLPFLTLSGC